MSEKYANFMALKLKSIMKKDKKNALPITLKSVKIENFGGIERTSLKDLPYNAQWIFLTGENGFGKTSVLQAIASAFDPEGYIFLYNQQKHFEKPVIPTIDVQLNYCGSLKTSYIFEWLGGGVNPIESTFVLKEFATYGTSRLEIAHDTSSNEAADKSGRLYSLFRTDGVLLSVEAEMKVWEKRDKTYFDNLRNTLLKILDRNIGDIYIDESENAKVKYVELDKKGNKLPPVTFEKLASGYRSIVAMVGDLLIRFYKIYPKNTPPEEFAGIVLIDELDVHLHPRMQKKIPGILSGVFPKMQFIASIHSPIPILGAPENAIFLKVFRTKEEGITVEHLDQVQVRSLTPNTLLSSPIFDFDEIIGDHHDRAADRLATEDHYDETVFAQVLEKKLKEMAAASNIAPEKITK
jgi:energy-coupling factor transporter ATP-binding protein EcfA2